MREPEIIEMTDPSTGRTVYATDLALDPAAQKSGFDAEVRPMVPLDARVLLSGVVGSQRYGLAGPDSDVDRIGVFAHATEKRWGQVDDEVFPETYRTETPMPDVTLHEARKYCFLALKCNPTVTELMWLDDYEVATPLGLALVASRASFLSQRRVRKAYLGYVSDQLKKLKDRNNGTFSSDTQHRTAKHARHIYRLLHQGYQLYSTGVLTLLVDDPEKVMEFGRRVAKGEIHLADEELARFEKLFDEALSPLPEQPYRQAAIEWLEHVRREMLNPQDPVDTLVGHPLLGQRVRAVLDRRDGDAVITGKLLRLEGGGEVSVLQDDGQVMHGWPALEIEHAGPSYARGGFIPAP